MMRKGLLQLLYIFTTKRKLLNVFSCMRIFPPDFSTAYCLTQLLSFYSGDHHEYEMCFKFCVYDINDKHLVNILITLNFR